MESKKLQQMQQANSHLAPMSMGHHNKSQPAFHHYPSGPNDYRTTQSPVFQSSATTPQQGGHQYQGITANFGQLNLGTSGPVQRHLQSQQPAQHPHLHVKPMQMNHGLQSRYNLQQSPQQAPQSGHSFYESEQLYQNNRERLYQQAGAASIPSSGAPIARSNVPAQSMLQSQQPATVSHAHNHPINALQQQYQQLQQAKIQQQMQTQNEAVIQSQRTFALRQQLNPPVAQSHFHLGHGQSQMSIMQSQQHINTMAPQSQQPPTHTTQPQSQSHHPVPALRNIPPSTLNLTNQFQPASGPMKLNSSDPHNIYGATRQPTNTALHQQQHSQHNQHDEKLNLKSPSEQTPIIQQNHPGLVVNQACQTQLSGTKGAKSPEDSSPSHTSSDRRKSTGTVHSIKSPVTKRPAAATVTLSGWLYKQGSDGLKVWRKRWFVLAEYCLFYYKGPEEEKVLGSVLLPSYIVSACALDDKIYRKFAFKCEHQNMRTYWLAAETAESMGQWVRALTAATMMQGSATSSDQTSQPSVSSLNPSNENSDSGIHTYQSQHSKVIGGLSVGNTIVPGPVTPASDSGGGPQPLYANAPPKPRRANDGGYSSPSPENSIERYDQSFDQRYQAESIYNTGAARRSDMKSPVQFQTQSQPSAVDQIYDNRNLRHQAKTPDPARMRYETNELSRLHAKSPFPGTEPNTHDLQQLQNIYATENVHAQPSVDHIIRAPQRFEDHKLYGTNPMADDIYMQHAAGKYAQQQQPATQLTQQQQLYLQQHQQQLQQLQQSLRNTSTTANNYGGSSEQKTPESYGRSAKPDAIDQRFFSTDYEDIYNLGPQHQQQQLQMQEAYRRPLSPPMAAHSKYVPNAHDLEMAAHMAHHQTPVNMRSKSIQSSIARPHSADFLEYEARHMDTSRLAPEPVRAPRPKSSLDINRTPDHMYYSEASYAEKMRQSALYLQKPASGASPMADKNNFEMQQMQLQQQQFMSPTESAYSPGVTSNTVPRMHESDFDRANRLELEQIHQNAMSSASVPRTHRSHSRNANLSAYQQQQQQQLQQEQFLRSASARLPRKNQEEDPAGAGFRDGERKREESMKRLLEWKQRMLQSPLTRKGTQAMDAKSPSASLHQQMMAAGVQRSRSETHANAGGVGAGYNSYSSDDEDEAPHLPPAGRPSVPSRPTTTNTTTTTTATHTITTPHTTITPTPTPSTTTISPSSLPMTTTTMISQPPQSSSQSHPITQTDPNAQPPQTRVANIRAKPPKPPPKPQSSINKLDSEPAEPTNLSYVPVYAQESALLSCSSSISEKLNESSTSSPSSTLTKSFKTKLDAKPSAEVEAPAEDAEVVSEKDLHSLTETLVDEDEEFVDCLTDNNMNISSAEHTSHVEPELEEEQTTNIATSIPTESVQSDVDEDDVEEDDDDKTFEYTDDDLDEALEDLPTDPVTPTNATSIGMDANENPYMLMTPRKSVLSQSENNIYLQSTKPEKDDSTYVEMSTMGGPHSAPMPDDCANSNYELVTFNGARSTSSHKRTESEPVYMELSAFKKAPTTVKAVEKLDKIVHTNNGKSTIRKSALKSKIVDIRKRSKKSQNLPDIVKPSQNVVIPNSDSSDADDESTSKEPMDQRSRSRFSLSDTFRPASYYLGATRPLAECPDSSDSEIVSPPPIPSTPPPLEELKTEEIFSSENYDTVKRRSVDKQILNMSYDQLPKIHSSSSSLNSIKRDAGLKSSRLSLPDHFAKQQKMQRKQEEENDYGFITSPAKRNSESSYSYHTDNSSIASSDYDLYNKVKLQSPSFHSSPIASGSGFQEPDEPVEIRSTSESLLYERQMKRRPLSEDSLSEIESMGDRFDESIGHADLDVYLSKLQNSDLCLYQNTDPSWINDSKMSNVPIIKPPDVFRSDNHNYYGNIRFQGSKEAIDEQFHVGEAVSTAVRPESVLSTSNGTYYDSLEEKHIIVPAPMTFSPSSLKERNLSLHDAQCESADRVSFGKGTASSHSRTNSNLSDTVPYYYADLAKGASPVSSTMTTYDSSPKSDCSTLKLNNQRDIGVFKRNTDITHIHNPISKQNLVGAMELQNESKDRLIESKHLFGSVEKNASKEAPSGYAANKLYGIKPTNLNSPDFRVHQMNDATGELHWEEDAIWRESLRRVSHRHARSLDALDRLDAGEQAVVDHVPAPRNEGRFGPLPPLPTEELTTQTLRRKKPRRSEPVVAPKHHDDHDVYVQLAAQTDMYERLKESNIPNSRKSIEINRDLIRQWDSMSSGLMKSGPAGGSGGAGGGSSGVGVCAAFGGGGLSAAGKKLDTLIGSSGGGGSSSSAGGQSTSGLHSTTEGRTNKHHHHAGNKPISTSFNSNASISVRNVRNLHKLKVKGMDMSNGGSSPTNINRNASNSNLNYYTHPGGQEGLTDSYNMKADYYNNGKSEDVYGVHRQQQQQQQQSQSQQRSLRQSQSRSGSRGNLNQMEQQEAAIRNRIRTCDGNTRTENLSRLDQLKQQLLDLEKQYEKSKPLVNLVDNMVKLGSLYRNGTAQSPSSQSLHHRQGPAESIALDRMEFNQRMQERRLLQDERKQWDRMSPNQSEMQSKVQQLYQLDQLMHEESGTLQSLQRDKEDLERALGGLRKRIQEGNGPPQIIEAARKQQHTLERELSRVHQMLAENSKKLEQTVAGNARLEQELLILRQKLQASRGARGSHSALGSQNGGAPDSISYTGGTTAVLETELRRVQNMVGDMQRQRQELSQAVRQLTENSQTLYQQVKPPKESMSGSLTSLAPSAMASSSSHIKKHRSNSTSWAETDLDSMYSIDHGTFGTSMDNLSMSRTDLSNTTTPLYIDTDSANTSGMSILNCSSSSKIPSTRSHHQSEMDHIESSGLDSDDLLENSAFAHLTGQEKPEPKTVRIVKRESERRHRDRERGQVASSSQHLDHVTEEEAQFIEDFNRSKSLPRSYLDTQELYTQPESKADRMQQQCTTTSSMYASSPAIPIKYTDYYSMSANQPQYPVSMSNVDSYMQRNHQPPSSNSYLGQSAPEPVLNSKNPFHMYMTGAEAQPTVHTAGLRNKTESIQSLNKAMGSLSPIFQSEAARQIITEMATGNTSEENNEKIPLAAAQKKKRATSRDSRRYMTAPSNTINPKSMQNIQSENDMNKNNTNWRARDDLDMEVALRPRINAPDVVRSALGQREKISENSIDRLFAAPNKIVIPERYIPEQAPEMSPEEKKRRQEKVEVIKKMLSEAPINQSNDAASLPPSQISAEKKQREHLLQLNQILAQQVMQMSKIVAERAMAEHQEQTANGNGDSDRDQSPVSPLPIYQQRDNFFS